MVVTQKKQRESGVEFLRIFAACMVVWLHTTLPWGIQTASSGLNTFVVHIMEIIAIPAVDIFILISGYFMASKSERSVGKPVSLLIQLFVIKFLFFFPAFFYKYPQVPFENYVVLPNDYFITLYIGLYFISPYINKIVDGLTIKQCKTLLITSAIILSVYPIFWDYLNLYTGSQASGVSTVSRWHDDSGQNIITFIFIYLVGSLLNKTKVEQYITKQKAMLLWLVASGVLLALYHLDERFTNDVYGCVSLFYHNPLVIIQAVALFLLFKKLTFKSRMINMLAASAFTCYLVHPYFLKYLRIDSFLQGSPIVIVLYYFAIALIIYLASYLIYWCYNLVTKRFFKRLDQVKINYY